jgi:hypothetical protein
MATVNWRLPACKIAFQAQNFAFTTRNIGPNTANSQNMIFVAPETGVYTRIVMQATAETIAATSLLKYGFQGITNAVANTPPGIPDGTYISSATTDANLFNIGVAPTITNNYIVLSGLSATLTKGTPYAMVLQPNTNWTAGYNITVRAAMTSVQEADTVTHYHINNATAGTGLPAYGIGTTSKWYGYPAPFTTPADALNPAGADNQIGIKFIMPTAITSFKIRGWWINNLRMGFGSDNTATVRLIDSSNTTLQQVAVDFNKVRATQFWYRHFFEFTDTLATLTGGSTYYIVLQTGNGANNTMTGFTINSDYAEAFSTFTHELVYRNGTTGSFLSTTAPETSLCLHDLVLEDVTTAGAGGGMIVHPGMSGGMRG